MPILIMLHLHTINAEHTISADTSQNAESHNSSVIRNRGSDQLSGTRSKASNTSPPGPQSEQFSIPSVQVTAMKLRVIAKSSLQLSPNKDAGQRTAAMLRGLELL